MVRIAGRRFPIRARLDAHFAYHGPSAQLLSDGARISADLAGGTGVGRLHVAEALSCRRMVPAKG